MKCSAAMMRNTGYLHIIALIVAIYGTVKQIDAVNSGKPFSVALSLSLTAMLLLRIPNQICVSFEKFDGWYTVIGTLMGVIGFAYLTYITFEKDKNNKKKN